MNCFKKFLWAIVFCTLGIISIPIITLPIQPGSVEMFEPSLFVMLLGYFLAGSVFLMVLVTELLRRLSFLLPIYSFIGSKGMYRLFLLAVLICWAFVIWLPPSNDLVFGSQFVAGLILPLHFYVKKTREIVCL
jgi:hypothetical protein